MSSSAPTTLEMAIVFCRDVARCHQPGETDGAGAAGVFATAGTAPDIVLVAGTTGNLPLL